VPGLQDSGDECTPAREPRDLAPALAGRDEQQHDGDWATAARSWAAECAAKPPTRRGNSRRRAGSSCSRRAPAPGRRTSTMAVATRSQCVRPSRWCASTLTSMRSASAASITDRSLRHLKTFMSRSRPSAMRMTSRGQTAALYRPWVQRLTATISVSPTTTAATALSRTARATRKRRATTTPTTATARTPRRASRGPRPRRRQP